jgi:glycerol-3-phosphate dehydrogenase
MHPVLPYVDAEVIWAAQWEMARTVEDVLSRRPRALLLNTRAALAMALGVAELLAGELGRNIWWKEAQVAQFNALASSYLPPDLSPRQLLAVRRVWCRS